MGSKSDVKITRDGNKVEVRHNEDDSLLAWCYIGDDAMVEKIADLLSSKKQGAAAEQLRRMAMDARRMPGPGEDVRLRG